MADRDQPQQATHKAYSVIKREGQDDFWLNLGLAFPHKDGKGFNIMLQALPLDGKIVCREPSGDDHAEEVERGFERDGRAQRQRGLGDAGFEDGRAPGPPTFRLCNPPSSSSLSTCGRRGRWASTCRRRCSLSPTR